MAVENPNFILKGIRRAAEIMLPIGLLGIGIGLFKPRLMGPSLGVTSLSWAIENLIVKSHLARAAA